jgi:hypothetical protein
MASKCRRDRAATCNRVCRGAVRANEAADPHGGRDGGAALPPPRVPESVMPLPSVEVSEAVPIVRCKDNDQPPQSPENAHICRTSPPHQQHSERTRHSRGPVRGRRRERNLRRKSRQSRNTQRATCERKNRQGTRRLAFDPHEFRIHEVGLVWLRLCDTRDEKQRRREARRVFAAGADHAADDGGWSGL